MIAKILGILDMLAIGVILANDYLPIQLIILTALYLMIKGFVFAMQGDKISMGDILVGIYGIFIIADITHALITLIAIIFLGQKAIFSLFA